MLLASLSQTPIFAFAILLALILVIPLLFERIKLPGLVGLLAAGMVLGPNGLKVFQQESEAMRLLSDIGVIYLMFVAGLEVDLDQFTRTRDRSIGFGSFTFIVPMIAGTAVGRMFGFDWNPSILIGSLFASHTLLAYPIISRLGVINNEAVTVTIGATIFTDVGALLVLAVCVAIHAGSFTLWSLATLLGSLALYTVVVLFGVDWAGRAFFQRSRNDEGNQFLFVLLAVFLAAVGAQLIGVEKIVGAFLSGLAVNRVLGESPVKEKVVFVGSVLFIPIFFVDMGLLVRIPAFIQSLTTPQLLAQTIAVVVGLIGSKFGAALLAKWVYRYSWQEALTMWSLSLPQVAATLAATLVGYRAGLLTEGILNAVIVLMVVTSTLGPILTARYANGLPTPDLATEPPVWLATETDPQALVVVPVYNPRTERYLLEMAAMLARSGKIMPLAIALSRSAMDSPAMQTAVNQAETLLGAASAICSELNIPAQPRLRIDDKIAQGITRTSREQNATLIVMGWGRRHQPITRLFGSIIDSVLWIAHCPVAIARLLDSPANLRRILVPIENLTEQSLYALQFAEKIAIANQGHITLLHVCDRATSPNQRAWTESQLTLLADKIKLTPPPTITIITDDDLPLTIVTTAHQHDLVVLRSSQRPLSAGGLAVSDLIAQLTQQIPCSIVLLGQPSRVARKLGADTI
jgi:Kef-type K+ transport system membrane component KefB